VVPFDQALTWICAGVQPLGAAYVADLRRGVLEQRWVDLALNQGKTAGAFSTGAPGTQPYVLVSYTDDVLSLSTLAHELGHSLHSYYAWGSQPFVYANYATFIAEVASNVNQALVRDYVLRTVPDRDVQIALLEEAMSNYHRYLFLMPTLARLEFWMHTQVEQSEALTADALSAQMADLLAEGYGGEVMLDRERMGITWAEFHTHLYDDYYVFQYTTGIAGAHALAQQVLTEGAPAAERYLAFLRAGGSLYPLDALRAAGGDLTTPAPIGAAYDYLGTLVDRLADLLGVSAE
jgi:oligoendopeptidase F